MRSLWVVWVWKTYTRVCWCINSQDSKSWNSFHQRRSPADFCRGVAQTEIAIWTDPRKKATDLRNVVGFRSFACKPSVWKKKPCMNQLLAIKFSRSQFYWTECSKPFQLTLLWTYISFIFEVKSEMDKYLLLRSTRWTSFFQHFDLQFHVEKIFRALFQDTYSNGKKNIFILNNVELLFFWIFCGKNATD